MKLPQIEAKFNKSTGVLDFSMCDLKDVQFLRKLSNSKLAGRITKLDLSDNAIYEMPGELDFFPEKMVSAVREIDLSSNKLMSVPTCLGAFTNLTKLVLAANNVDDLSVDVFGRLGKLQYLDVSRNNNLDAKWKKILSTGANPRELATQVKNYALPEFEKLEKTRAKKQKQAEKKQQKARLAEKARQKEIRRQAWEEKQRVENEKAAGDQNSESEVEYPSCDDLSSEDETSALINKPDGQKQQGGFLYRSLVNLSCYTFFGIVWIFKICALVCCSILITGWVSYTFCYMTGQHGYEAPSSTVLTICPVIISQVERVWDMILDLIAIYWTGESLEELDPMRYIMKQ